MELGRGIGPAWGPIWSHSAPECSNPLTIGWFIVGVLKGVELPEQLFAKAVGYIGLHELPRTEVWIWVDHLLWHSGVLWWCLHR